MSASKTFTNAGINPGVRPDQKLGGAPSPAR